MKIVVQVFSNTAPTTPLTEVTLKIEEDKNCLLSSNVTSSTHGKILNNNNGYQLESPIGVKGLADNICNVMQNKKAPFLEILLKEMGYITSETAGAWPDSHNHKHFIIKLCDSENNALAAYIFNEEGGSLTLQ